MSERIFCQTWVKQYLSKRACVLFSCIWYNANPNLNWPINQAGCLMLVIPLLEGKVLVAYGGTWGSDPRELGHSVTTGRVPSPWYCPCHFKTGDRGSSSSEVSLACKWQMKLKVNANHNFNWPIMLFPLHFRIGRPVPAWAEGVLGRTVVPRRIDGAHGGSEVPAPVRRVAPGADYINIIYYL
jgi:hypothetical protein